MAVPSVVARTTSNPAASFTPSVSLGSPTGGNILLVIVAYSGTGALEINRPLSGLGWFKVASGGTGHTLNAFAKIAAGSDVLVLNSESSFHRIAAVTYEVSGHGSTVAVSAAATASSTNADPAAVSQTNSQDTLYIAAASTASSVASAAPSGYSSLTTVASNGSLVFLSTAEMTATGSTTDNPGTFTNTSQRWNALAFAIGATGNTSNARVTQAVAEALNDGAPNAVVTQVVAESLSANALMALITQVVAEMVSTNVPNDGGDNARVGFIM